MVKMATLKSGLSGLSLLLFVMSGSVTSQQNSVVKKSYKHYTRHYTWTEAQRFCRSHHTDLAIFSKWSELDELQVSRYNAWINLFTKTNGVEQEPLALTYSSNSSPPRLATNEPDIQDKCTYVSYPSLKVHGTNCEAYHFFFCSSSNPDDPRHYFLPVPVTWLEAQIHCQSRQEVLSSFANDTSLKNISAVNFSAWIGLHSEDGETWKWSAGSSQFSHWAPAQSTSAVARCVSIWSSTKHMYRQDCSHRLPFVCVGDNVLLVKEKKTWEEALQYCRALNSTAGGRPVYDLVSVQPGEDHHYMMAKARSAETEEVWVGLRFLAGVWLWVDGAAVSHADLPSCPDDWRHCGVLSRDNKDNVETKACTETRNFLCYRK